MSSSFLYDKFFHIEPFVSIDAFDKFVLSNENKERFCLYNPIPIRIPIPLPILMVPPPPPPPPSPSQTQSTLVLPRCEDTLFWCGFIAGNGYQAFRQIGSKYKNKELEEKQAMMESIKKNPLQMKTTNHKLSNLAIQEIMSSLMVDKKTTLMAFIGICVYYKIHVFLVNEVNQTYLEYRPENVDDTNPLPAYIIYRTKDILYKIDTDTRIEKIEEIHNTMIPLEFYYKPFKGVSCYKVHELEAFAKKIGKLDLENTKWKKADLYNKLYEICVWHE